MARPRRSGTPAKPWASAATNLSWSIVAEPWRIAAIGQAARKRHSIVLVPLTRRQRPFHLTLITPFPLTADVLRVLPWWASLRLTAQRCSRAVAGARRGPDRIAKLIEDTQRDWTALGQEKLRIVPQSRFRQGTPIRLNDGILFTTYATLRSSEREGKASRLTQIIDWLTTSPDEPFAGVIVLIRSTCRTRASSRAPPP